MKTVRILLVEDDPEVASLYLTRLNEENFSVVHVFTGSQALTYMLNKDNVVADVILLDLMLPGISGFDVIKAVHKDTHWRSVPIVVLTAFADTTREADARKLGITHYHLKTEITPGELVAEIKQVVAGQ